jgi:hypothetical protein
VPILDAWSLGANNRQFAGYHGWVELDIESPNPVSRKIGFAIHIPAGCKYSPHP